MSMKEKAIEYYRNGNNCSQCILKAASDTFQIPLSDQTLYSCAGINNGFGIGGMCSVLIAGIMVFGILFEDEIARKLRMKLLMVFQEKHGCFYCSQIVRERGMENNCEIVIGDTAQMIEQIILDQKAGK